MFLNTSDPTGSAAIISLSHMNKYTDTVCRRHCVKFLRSNKLVRNVDTHHTPANLRFYHRAKITKVCSWRVPIEKRPTRKGVGRKQPGSHEEAFTGMPRDTRLWNAALRLKLNINLDSPKMSPTFVSAERTVFVAVCCNCISIHHHHHHHHHHHRSAGSGALTSFQTFPNTRLFIRNGRSATSTRRVSLISVCCSLFASVFLLRVGVHEMNNDM